MFRGANQAARRRALTTAALTVAAVGVLAACSSGPGSAPAGPVTLEVWRHAGTPAEVQTLVRQVHAFEAVHPEVEVRLRTIAEGDYNDTLQAASAGDALPDVLEIDGPNIASYVYQGRVRPLDGLLPDRVLAAQLPSARSQGSQGGHTYAVSVFDSGLGIFADRAQLRAAGVRRPTGDDDAWTAAELSRVLARLAGQDPDGKVLDLKLNYGTGEWLTYGFAPLVASAGGSLLDARGRARGSLDGPPAVRALRTLASWAPYVDANTDDDAFVNREVALSWVGHWAYPDYAEALGKDLLVLPLPDLGSGTRTGQGSWAWSVSARSPHAAAARQLLEFLLSDDEVIRMTDANGAVPATTTALPRSALYAEQGPLRLFADQLLHSCGSRSVGRDCVAVPRPVTPGYPLLSAQFAAAVADAVAGRPVLPALRHAARQVDEDRRLNRGYR